MVKVTVVEPQESPFEFKRGSIVKYRSGKLVLVSSVFSNGQFSGTVIKGDEWHQIGEFLDSWQQSCFCPFLGKVTLEQ